MCTCIREKLHIDRDKMLRLAAKDGDDGRCVALIQKGASVNKVGGSHRHTAMHYAARNGHVRCMDALIKCKADPNIQNGDGICVAVYDAVCCRE